jgi:hypothetical protein
LPSELLSSAALLRSQLAGFEPGQLSGEDCARLAEELAATEKACAAARVLAAARAISCRALEGRGFAEGAAWVARQSGGGVGQARQVLEAVAGLADCPGTKAALLAGEVSWAEASEVTKAQHDAPGTEEALLQAARHGGLGELRERAREHRFSNTPVAELHRQQHRARHFRHWRDRLGMVCFAGALAPEAGVAFVHRVERAAQRLGREAAAAGNSAGQRFEAYAADALAAIANGEGAQRKDRADLVIVCDINAWRRGHANPGEVCQIIDGGPVPVDIARHLSKDAFLKAVLHDGVAVGTVKHFGRHVPAELRTALDLGPAPQFTGAQCADCGGRFGLEYDHVNPLANLGPTSLANLEARCWPDHQAKTEQDRKAGLLGPRPPSRSTGPPTYGEDN